MSHEGTFRVLGSCDDETGSGTHRIKIRSCRPAENQASERSARKGDPGAQDGEHGSDATRAPPFYRVPPCEVAHRIEREQPNEYPDPDAENVL
jgi:hypothetical protein